MMAGVPYGGDGFGIHASQSGPADRPLAHVPYVTVHNGYDPNMVVSSARATKCYPHFGEVINHLRRRHPDIVFVQVGTSTSVRIDEADLCLVGSTTLPEVAGLIRGAVMHLDNEGGLVHLARAVGTICCVVFGPTSPRYFGYPANINIDPPFCGGCWWVNETWMSHCPRGFATPRCMVEQPSAVVAEAAERYLRTSSGYTSSKFRRGVIPLAAPGDTNRQRTSRCEPVIIRPGRDDGSVRC
jgi:ADP-heptose:LPS heptosyltransferase